MDLSHRPQRYSPNSVIESVVNDYLERTSSNYKSHKVEDGIYWDKLFLPVGTKLRTKYYGEEIEAEVKNGNIVWKGGKYNSVSQAINAMRGNTSNNAWLATDIKRPGDVSWNYANRLRF